MPLIDEIRFGAKGSGSPLMLIGAVLLPLPGTELLDAELLLCDRRYLVDELGGTGPLGAHPAAAARLAGS